MRHRHKNKILDRTKEAREMMLRNLAASVIIYEKVKTTTAKAKAVRSLLEKCIGLAVANTLHSRREIAKILTQPLAIKKSVEILSQRYQGKKSGHVRIVKLAPRAGDGAELSQIELL